MDVDLKQKVMPWPEGALGDVQNNNASNESGEPPSTP